MKKMFFALVAVLCSTYAMAQDAYLQVTLTNDAVTKISLSDIKDFRFVTEGATDPEPDPDVPEGAVDLGLSVKWASCNIGASQPEEYGSYFAFGETEEKDAFTVENSEWYSVSYSSRISQGLLDKNGILTPKYDAATVNWGNDWRMPTHTECEELKSNCTWTWTSVNGISGYNVVGPNGNSIFLPAAGWKRYGSEGGFGTTVNCWTSEVASSTNWAYFIDVDSTSLWPTPGWDYADCGRPIRAVRK